MTSVYISGYYGEIRFLSENNSYLIEGKVILSIMHHPVIKKAFYTTIPVMAGYIVLGIGFGILLRNAGFGVVWSFAMSVLISGERQRQIRQTPVFQMTVLPLILLFCLVYLAAGSYNPFIYFRF